MANKQLNPTLLSTAVAAGLAATTMPAHALSLGISGQINKVIGFYDNGDNNAYGFFDNNNSGSRFRFTGQEDIGGGLKVGGVWEWQWSNSPAGAATFNSNGEISESSATLQDRKTELFFAGNWGKVSLGKGDGAANGTAEVDLSGTSVLDYAGGNQCLLGSMTYGSAGPTVGSTYSQYDGESRNTRIRYDTPKLAKVFTVSLSLPNGKGTELAARYAQTIGSTKVAVALGLTDRKDAGGGAQDRKRTAISGSAILKNGLNFTVSYSTQERPASVDTTDNTNSMFKVGWKKGKHAAALSLGMQSDTTFDGGSVSGVSDDEAETFALTYNYTPAKGVEIYAGYRDSSIDASGSKDVSAIFVGSRIKWK